MKYLLSKKKNGSKKDLKKIVFWYGNYLEHRKNSHVYIIHRSKFFLVDE